jgi:hypothetical protein
MVTAAALREGYTMVFANSAQRVRYPQVSGHPAARQQSGRGTKVRAPRESTSEPGALAGG